LQLRPILLRRDDHRRPRLRRLLLQFLHVITRILRVIPAPHPFDHLSPSHHLSLKARRIPDPRNHHQPVSAQVFHRATRPVRRPSCIRGSTPPASVPPRASARTTTARPPFSPSRPR